MQNLLKKRIKLFTSTVKTKFLSQFILPDYVLLFFSFESTDDDDSKLGGGAIAGIVLGIAVVLAVGFLIGYYKLVKPRLFSRLTETGTGID